MDKIEFCCLGDKIEFKGKILAKPNKKAVLLYAYMLKQGEGGTLSVKTIKELLWDWPEAAQDQSWNTLKKALIKIFGEAVSGFEEKEFFTVHPLNSDLKIFKQEGVHRKNEEVLLNLFGKFFGDQAFDNVLDSAKTPTMHHWLDDTRQELNADFWNTIAILFEKKSTLDQQLDLITRACQTIKWERELFLFPAKDTKRAEREKGYSIATLVHCCLFLSGNVEHISQFKAMCQRELDEPEDFEEELELKEILQPPPKACSNLIPLASSITRSPSYTPAPFNITLKTPTRSEKTEVPYDQIGPWIGEVYTKAGFFTITGGTRNGKTTILNALFNHLKTSSKDDTGETCLVLPLDISTWTPALKEAPCEKQLFTYAAPQHKISSSNLQQQLHKKQVIVLIDGIDALKHEEQKTWADLLKSWCDTYPFKGVVLTCHDSTFERIKELLPSYLHSYEVTTSKLSTQQRETLLKNALDSHLLQEYNLMKWTSSLNIGQLQKTIEIIRETKPNKEQNPPTFQESLTRDYVTTNLKSLTSDDKHPFPNANRHLAWIAHCLSNITVEPKVFESTLLQPAILSSKAEKRIYTILSRLAIGLCLGGYVTLFMLMDTWLTPFITRGSLSPLVPDQQGIGITIGLLMGLLGMWQTWHVFEHNTPLQRWKMVLAWLGTGILFLLWGFRHAPSLWFTLSTPIWSFLIFLFCCPPPRSSHKAKQSPDDYSFINHDIYADPYHAFSRKSDLTKLGPALASDNNQGRGFKRMSYALIVFFILGMIALWLAPEILVLINISFFLLFLGLILTLYMYASERDNESPVTTPSASLSASALNYIALRWGGTRLPFIVLLIYCLLICLTYVQFQINYKEPMLEAFQASWLWLGYLWLALCLGILIMAMAAGKIVDAVKHLTLQKLLQWNSWVPSDLHMFLLQAEKHNVLKRQDKGWLFVPTALEDYFNKEYEPFTSTGNDTKHEEAPLE